MQVREGTTIAPGATNPRNGPACHLPPASTNILGYCIRIYSMTGDFEMRRRQRRN
ncbi:hypothetical protein J6590_052817 [Homalodisca vitripennis]|nr:hypothetical protein J6590_052817 [Homalodisca vitripennis]